MKKRKKERESLKIVTIFQIQNLKCIIEVLLDWYIAVTTMCFALTSAVAWLTSEKVEAAAGLGGLALQPEGPADRTGVAAFNGQLQCGKPEGGGGLSAGCEISREEGLWQFTGGR